jgi:hypothetical protein
MAASTAFLVSSCITGNVAVPVPMPTAGIGRAFPDRRATSGTADVTFEAMTRPWSLLSCGAAAYEWMRAEQASERDEDAVPVSLSRIYNTGSGR